MKNNKYTTLMAGGGVALVLLILAGLFLHSKNKQYREVSRVLRTEEQQLDQLNRRDPFPSPENLEVQKENLEKVQQQLDQLLALVRQGRLDAPQMEAADFAQFLETVQRELIQRARRTGTRLPDRPAFGFPRYFSGERPEPEHIPRLVRQMKMVELLCRELFDARITSLVSVERQRFDQPQDAATGGRGRERVPTLGLEDATPEEEKRHEQDLYAWESFTVEFTARESAVWSLIERISRSAVPMRIVSFSVEADEARPGVADGAMRRQEPDLGRRPMPPPTRERELAPGTDELRRRTFDPGEVLDPGDTGEAAPVIPPREQRVVMGRELLKVVLKVNVYRFLDDGEEGEKSL